MCTCQVISINVRFLSSKNKGRSDIGVSALWFSTWTYKSLFVSHKTVDSTKQEFSPDSLVSKLSLKKVKKLVGNHKDSSLTPLVLYITLLYPLPTWKIVGVKVPGARCDLRAP